jgi:rhodanese-related sulfurtransferase
LDDLIAAAATRVRRYLPAEAQAAAAHGAVIVDIRAADARGRDGVIPGARHVPRTVLEWRVASRDWRNPDIAGRRLIVVCDEGYSSLLAAATLLELGVDAGDLVGGFAAWRAARLPTVEARPFAGLPGMAPPD